MTKIPAGAGFIPVHDAPSRKKLNFMGNEFGQLREWDENVLRTGF